MNFFKNFEFGPVKNDTVRLSPMALRLRTLMAAESLMMAPVILLLTLMC